MSWGRRRRSDEEWPRPFDRRRGREYDTKPTAFKTVALTARCDGLAAFLRSGGEWPPAESMVVAVQRYPAWMADDTLVSQYTWTFALTWAEAYAGRVASQQRTEE